MATLRSRALAGVSMATSRDSSPSTVKQASTGSPNHHRGPLRFRRVFIPGWRVTGSSSVSTGAAVDPPVRHLSDRARPPGSHLGGSWEPPGSPLAPDLVNRSSWATTNPPVPVRRGSPFARRPRASSSTLHETRKARLTCIVDRDWKSSVRSRKARVSGVRDAKAF